MFVFCFVIIFCFVSFLFFFCLFFFCLLGNPSPSAPAKHTPYITHPVTIFLFLLIIIAFEILTDRGEMRIFADDDDDVVGHYYLGTASRAPGNSARRTRRTGCPRCRCQSLADCSPARRCCASCSPPRRCSESSAACAILVFSIYSVSEFIFLFILRRRFRGGRGIWRSALFLKGGFTFRSRRSSARSRSC